MPEISIELSLDTNEDPQVHFDPITLASIISNLVNNAVEAVGSAGKIVLATRLSKKDVVIVVSDDGTGIPEHVLAELGEKRLTFAKNSSSGGTGLGLFHAFQAIKASNGTIAIQSKVGVGTLVNITLPRIT